MSTQRWKAARQTMLLALVWVLAIGAWEAGYRLIGWKAWVFPAPSHVVDATCSMLNVSTAFGEPVGPGWPWKSPDAAPTTRQTPPLAESPLVRALPITGGRLLAGFAAGIAAGLVLGVAMWRFAFVDALFGPVFLGLQTLPSVCWVPLAILTFGINEQSILFVLFMGSVFAIAISFRDGMRTVPPIFRTAGLMLGARKWRLFRYVLIPASLPALAGTLRQGFSFAWRSLMGAELILLVQRRGVGYLLNIGREFSDVAQVVAVLVVMVAVGMAIDRWVFAVVEKKIRHRFGLAMGS